MWYTIDRTLESVIKMKSLKELFLYGPGPSSSHTIGPQRAAEIFKNQVKDASSFFVILYGSLALTGKGHLTDVILKKVLGENTTIIFDTNLQNLVHPNTMAFLAFDKNNQLIAKKTCYSLGGGAISFENETYLESKEVYPFNSFNEMNLYLKKLNFKSYDELVTYYEDKDIQNYLQFCLNKMFECVENGLKATGLIPGKLKLERVAKQIFENAKNASLDEQKKLYITAFAYAVAENNASGLNVITAPTCGSAGVLAAVLYYEYFFHQQSLEKLTKALMVAGLIGNLVKTMASISGAIGGCQAEIGTATSMAAAALCTLYDLSNQQIEYASELAMEHMLGLTCDPVLGYVQIPCIERNAIAALRVYDAFLYAKVISHSRKNRISLDDVIKAMKITGDELSFDYKETSQGGLAKIHDIKK